MSLITKTLKSILFVIFFVSMLASCSQQKIPFSSVVMVASVSTDGNYAVTSNLGKQLILWNIQDKIKKIISTDANVYSAYFIKNTNDFLWQDDKTNTVYVENVSGKIVKSLNPGFPTYGEAMTSDLKDYFASDEKWNVYKISNTTKQIIKQGFDGFLGTGKLLNLSLSNKNRYLITSGYAGNAGDDLPLSKGYTASDVNPKMPPSGNFSILNGVVLWDVTTGKPIHKLHGNVAKTYATISPNGKYVVSGDEDTTLLVWSTKNGKQLLNLPAILGYLKTKKSGKVYFDNKGFPKIPAGFHGEFNSPGFYIETIKFIDKDHYLRFPHGVPYTILYQVTNPIPKKYFPLSKKPWVGIEEYDRDQAIDTSPQAHILVMAMATGSGIVVYKYDPKNQSLKQIWVADGPPVKWLTVKQLNTPRGVAT